MAAWQKYLAEFFGTAILVGMGSFGILSAVGVDGGLSTAGMVVIALAFGMALLAGLYAFGETSGGHFNPAVTLAALADGRINLSDSIGYWVAQIAGGVFGSLIVLLGSSQAAVAGTSNGPSALTDNFGALLLEVFLTAIFVAVILRVTKDSDFGKSSLMAISLTLVGIHMAGIPLSGASVNPARSLGPALVGGANSASNMDVIWIYFLGPLVGAIVGWILYRVITQGDTDLTDDVKAAASS